MNTAWLLLAPVIGFIGLLYGLPLIFRVLPLVRAEPQTMTINKVAPIDREPQRHAGGSDDFGAELDRMMLELETRADLGDDRVQLTTAEASALLDRLTKGLKTEPGEPVAPSPETLQAMESARLLIERIRQSRAQAKRFIGGPEGT